MLAVCRCVRGRRPGDEAGAWANVEPGLVQILVVVAIIQMRTLKAEVEKGSMWTAIGHGLLDPKTRRKCLKKEFLLQSKGNGVNIPQASRVQRAVTLASPETPVRVPGRVLFSS